MRTLYQVHRAIALCELRMLRQMIRDGRQVYSALLPQGCAAQSGSTAQVSLAARGLRINHTTREAWLMAAIEQLRPHFQAAGYDIPANVKATCGWPSKSALSTKRTRIGECWSDDASVGKVFEMFISPKLADHVHVLATLTHELVHATVGLKVKHGAAFKRCALAVGLEGKMTATHAGDTLRPILEQFVRLELGDYPHSELRAMTNGQRKQGTRLVKVACDCCAYTVRVTRRWLDRGAPLCPLDGCDRRGEPMSEQAEGE